MRAQQSIAGFCRLRPGACRHGRVVLPTRSPTAGFGCMLDAWLPAPVLNFIPGLLGGAKRGGPSRHAERCGVGCDLQVSCQTAALGCAARFCALAKFAAAARPSYSNWKAKPGCSLCGLTN